MSVGQVGFNPLSLLSVLGMLGQNSVLSNQQSTQTSLFSQANYQQQSTQQYQQSYNPIIMIIQIIMQMFTQMFGITQGSYPTSTTTTTSSSPVATNSTNLKTVFNSFDENEDGKISEDELKNTITSGSLTDLTTAQQNIYNLLASNLADNNLTDDAAANDLFKSLAGDDGQLSLNELKTIDTNSDGKLTKTEFNTAKLKIQQSQPQQITLNVGESKDVTLDGKTYTISNSGQAFENQKYVDVTDAQTVTYSLNNDGQIEIQGNNLTITAKQGQDNSLLIKGTGNTITTDDGDDDVAVIGDSNSVSTGKGKDTLLYEGQNEYIDPGEDQDFTYPDVSDSIRLFAKVDKNKDYSLDQDELCLASLTGDTDLRNFINNLGNIGHYMYIDGDKTAFIPSSLFNNISSDGQTISLNDLLKLDLNKDNEVTQDEINTAKSKLNNKYTL